MSSGRQGGANSQINKYPQAKENSFRNSMERSPMANYNSQIVVEQQKYDEEKMLIEQDPFLLEE